MAKKITISVSRNKGNAPVILIYTPSTMESSTTNLSMEEYEKFQNGDHSQQLRIVMEAFADLFGVLDLHRKIYKGL